METRRFCLVLACLISACGSVTEGGDGGTTVDASYRDVPGSDALDAGPDAELNVPDMSDMAAATPDVAPDMPSGEPCSVNGRPGECLDVTDCISPRSPTPGFCPGAANIQCCTEIPAGTCEPSAMPRPNEGLTEAPGIGGCPAGMTPVDGYCIDVYEASLLDVDAGTTWSPYFNPGSTRVRAVSVAGAVPQGYINGIQAGAACAEAGKRLCTDMEWLRACQSSAGYTYPYGDVRMDGVCNDARAQHPAVEYFMSSDPSVFSMIDHPCLNQLADGLDTTGSNTSCVTEDGAYDMMGNLHEWTADPTGTFRGGFYVDTKINGEGCLYRTTAHNTQHWDYSTGFRCCADP